MIKLLRVDDRLIHGQVAMVWTSYLGANYILVANDKVPNDKMLQMTLKLGKPPGVKLNFLSIEDSVKFINDSSNDRYKIFVVCDKTNDALRLVEGTEKIQKVVLGGIRKGKENVLIDRQVFLDANDLSNWEKMEALGRKVSLQVIPSENEIGLQESRNIYNKRI